MRRCKLGALMLLALTGVLLPSISRADWVASSVEWSSDGMEEKFGTGNYAADPGTDTYSLLATGGNDAAYVYDSGVFGRLYSWFGSGTSTALDVTSTFTLSVAVTYPITEPALPSGTVIAASQSLAISSSHRNYSIGYSALVGHANAGVTMCASGVSASVTYNQGDIHSSGTGTVKVTGDFTP